MNALLPGRPGNNLKAYAALLVIAVVGFWPVTTGLFSLKNDDIIYFLPYRYNISVCIRSGMFPLWSPYLYMGLPVFGDMQSGVWNPFVWLLSLTGRYTLTTLHTELLLYIFIAGAGMYKLMQHISASRAICLTIAVCYMFSGFITDSGQIICWVACAAFLPYTYIYFIRLLKSPSPGDSAKFAMANFFLLIAAGYPFFFIANMYILAIAYLVFLIKALRRSKVKIAMTVLRYLALSGGLLILMGMAPLCSFIHLMPYYSRGQHLSLEKALYNSYSIHAALSLITPFATTRKLAAFGNNEVISRDLYTGILLLPFIIQTVLQKKTLWLYTVMLVTLAAFAISLGQLLPVRSWAYAYVPFMNTFRHPANFRLFVITGLLAVAAKGLHDYTTQQAAFNRSGVIRIFYVLLALFPIIALNTDAVYIPHRPFTISLRALKTMLDQISFGQAVWLSLLLQAPFVIAAIVLLKKNKMRWFYGMVVLNVIAISQPQIFICTVARQPAAAMNRFLQRQPSGFPLPDLTHPVGFAGKEKKYFNDYKVPIAFFFNKTVSINSVFNNPTILLRYEAFINDSSLAATVSNYPVMYLADSLITDATANQRYTMEKQEYWLRTHAARSAGRLRVIKFLPAEFEIGIRSDTISRLVILQNNHPGWKAYAGNTPIHIQTVNKTFMGLQVPKGAHIIRLKYSPDWFVWVMIISGLGFLGCAAILVRSRKIIGQKSVVSGQ